MGWFVLDGHILGLIAVLTCVQNKTVLSIYYFIIIAAYPYMPIQPNQWWRLFISPFYHNGLLHLILVLIPQLVLAIPIEKMAGGLRLFLIYILCDVTGNLVSISPL